VEHVLAALAGAGVTNAVVELDANEPPISDGSSREFARLVREAGILQQAETLEPFKVTAPIEFTRPEPRSDDDRRQEAVELVIETVEALITERGADDKIWGSMVKQTLKRRRPGFAESYYGYRSFNELLEEGRDRGLLALDRDEKSGGYVIRLL
jgi:hypothetical protein